MSTLHTLPRPAGPKAPRPPSARIARALDVIGRARQVLAELDDTDPEVAELAGRIDLYELRLLDMLDTAVAS